MEWPSPARRGWHPAKEGLAERRRGPYKDFFVMKRHLDIWQAAPSLILDDGWDDEPDAAWPHKLERA